MTAPTPARPAGAFLAVVVAVSALQPFALNVLAPATPGLSRSLETDYATVQLTLTLYLVTVAVSQLVVGPISDRIGRRPCILAGIALFALGSVLGALSNRIELLLLARVVQAAGSGTCFALARAAVQDSAPRDQIASLMGYITMAMVVSPMIAPLVGGFLDAAFGWRSIFVAMVALAAVVGVAAFLRLPETAPRRSDTSLLAMVQGYPTLLRHREFVAYALVLMFTTGAFFAFVAGAPYVVVDVMGRGPEVYGYFFLANASAYMLGNFISGRFGTRLGSVRLAGIGIVCSVAALVIEVICVLVLPWTPATLFLPFALNGFGNGLTIPGAVALTLGVEPRLAGTASGLAGALQLGFGALSAVATGYIVTVWPHGLIAAMLFMVLGAAAVFWLSAEKPAPAKG
jgi:DHA1 family bicyclomycin/chloramphenicol resistance-like MFS transporter